MGYEIILKKKQKRIKIGTTDKINLSKIKQDQLNPLLHLDLANQYFKLESYFTAWAEFKTACFLGLNESENLDSKKKFQEALPKLTQINHNPYFRLSSLANAIKDTAKEIPNIPKVLDVGGGDGSLASFIPEFDYCLVDPSTNGVDGLQLPFEDESFDFVVSCHVLEHIPLNDRNAFLSQLMAKAKKTVILLNPIYIEKTLPKERLEMLIETTNALWAKEHLDCSLPSIDSVREFAENNGLKFTFIPNGTLSTSIAMYVVDFLSKNWDSAKYTKFNEFYNTQYFEILNSNEYPNAGLLFLRSFEN